MNILYKNHQEEDGYARYILVTPIDSVYLTLSIYILSGKQTLSVTFIQIEKSKLDSYLGNALKATNAELSEFKDLIGLNPALTVPEIEKLEKWYENKEILVGSSFIHFRKVLAVNEFDDVKVLTIKCDKGLTYVDKVMKDCVPIKVLSSYWKPCNTLQVEKIESLVKSFSQELVG